MTARCALCMGALKIFKSPWVRPQLLLPKFLMDFCSDRFCECAYNWLQNLKFVALPIPEIIAIAVLGWGWEPQSWGRECREGSGMVPFESALESSYRLSIVTFNLSLRVSEILPLLCSSTPLFPTPPRLPKISLCFPGSRWVAFGLRRANWC